MLGFETSKQIGLVMEYAPHGDLFDHVDRQKGVKENCGKEMFRGILKGVQHCHKQGVAHRDLKPENILLSKGNTPKVREILISSIASWN